MTIRSANAMSLLIQSETSAERVDHSEFNGATAIAEVRYLSIVSLSELADSSVRNPATMPHTTIDVIFEATQNSLRLPIGSLRIRPLVPRLWVSEAWR